ncbi:uncharacterized protein N7529_005499 [Penicillium soppii]|jgi:hypothetical protein|uniref:uncharacterized protein n=1 Tax=Penicillium soppii TaxID=69789 RepID=UPI00254989F5|nr:uncharacterized protein N7529_005499 [Penicillium soppii]KAJ5863583.1 hypothetical protein N7529_005499 [Penicillium soppii]
MEAYLSHSILEELVRFGENGSTHADSVKERASVVLNYHFPVAHSYSVASERDRNNHVGDSIILRIRRWSPGARSVIDHTYAEAKGLDYELEMSLEQLENVLEHS